MCLGSLAEADSNQAPLQLGSATPEELQLCLSKMMLIRAVERQLAKGRRDGLIGGPIHLGVGQEAVAVGVSAALRASDRVFGAHRSHSHLLALGSDVRKLFAEVLARHTGHSRGMGGSMHLWDQSVGFYGSVPIVGRCPTGLLHGSRFQWKVCCAEDQAGLATPVWWSPWSSCQKMPNRTAPRWRQSGVAA